MAEQKDYQMAVRRAGKTAGRTARTRAYQMAESWVAAKAD